MGSNESLEARIQRLEDHQEILRSLLGSIIANSPQSVLHLELNPRVAIDITGDEASSTMMFAVARTQDDGLTRVVWLGHHHSRHVRTPDGWKINYRRNTVDLPETGHP